MKLKRSFSAAAIVVASLVLTSPALAAPIGGGPSPGGKCTACKCTYDTNWHRMCGCVAATQGQFKTCSVVTNGYGNQDCQGTACDVIYTFGATSITPA